MDYFGEIEIIEKKVGEVEIEKQYYGSTLVWEAVDELPENTMFNYNAKEYDLPRDILPKYKNQLLDFDILFDVTPPHIGEYLYFGNDPCNDIFNHCIITYENVEDNPFNRDSENRTLTIVYKTSGYTDEEDVENLLANRLEGDYNWMVRGDLFHTSDGSFLRFQPNVNPQIIVIRVDANGNAVRKSIDVNGNTLQSSAGTAVYGEKCKQFQFFKGGVPEGECEDFCNIEGKCSGT